MSAFATRELPAGTTCWCVHRADLPATGFNPNTRGDQSLGTSGGRFNPFETKHGIRVATKYLADHPNGAFAETLLRDGPGARDVSRATIETHRLAQLALRRSLMLADLSVVSPSSTLARLLRGGREAYPSLRDVAATVHASHPHLTGLLWEGRQLDLPGMHCIVLFGDRVSPDDDLALLDAYELDRDIGLRLLRATARLRRFTLPSGYAIDPASPRP